MNDRAKTAVQALAILFGILAIVLYVFSIREVGSIQVANIQLTVFAAACAVMCCVNVAALLVMKYIDSMNDNVYYGFEDLKKRIEKKD